MQHDERAEHDRAEARGEREVGVGDAEHVAEEQLLQPRGRVRRQREQRAEAEQAGDDDGDRRVVPDRRRAARDRDGERGDDQPRRAPDHERHAGERGDDEAGQQGVRERLGAVGEAVEDDPASERAAGRAERDDLDERPEVDRVAPGIEQPVEHQWSWWWGGRTPWPPPPGNSTIDPP